MRVISIPWHVDSARLQTAKSHAEIKWSCSNVVTHCDGIQSHKIIMPIWWLSMRCVLSAVFGGQPSLCCDRHCPSSLSSCECICFMRNGEGLRRLPKATEGHRRLSMSSNAALSGSLNESSKDKRFAQVLDDALVAVLQKELRLFAGCSGFYTLNWRKPVASYG